MGKMDISKRKIKKQNHSAKRILHRSIIDTIEKTLLCIICDISINELAASLGSDCFALWSHAVQKS